MGKDWIIYLWVFISLLDYASITKFRSLISKNVNANEVGKVFSVVGILKTLMPFLTAPVFGFLYKSTVESQANAFLFLVVGLKSTVLLFMIIVKLKERKTTFQPSENSWQDIIGFFLSNDLFLRLRYEGWKLMYKKSSTSSYESSSVSEFYKNCEYKIEFWCNYQNYCKNKLWWEIVFQSTNTWPCKVNLFVARTKTLTPIHWQVHISILKYSWLYS